LFALLDGDLRIQLGALFGEFSAEFVESITKTTLIRPQTGESDDRT
jgi:hypothetical protein